MTHDASRLLAIALLASGLTLGAACAGERGDVATDMEVGGAPGLGTKDAGAVPPGATTRDAAPAGSSDAPHSSGAGTLDAASSGAADGSSGEASDAGPGATSSSDAMTAAPGGGSGFYRMERLTRGLVAVKVEGGVYVGWRMYGYEYDAKEPSRIAFNVYRNGMKLATVTSSTNYLDGSGDASASYSVRAVVSGVEGAPSESAKVWSQQYLRVPLQVPPSGTTPSSCPTPSESYAYSANDTSVGDADGDGVYELFLKWDPANAKDNSQSGCTGNVYLDAYKIDGTRLWRIDLGPNIRAGAHYTQFVVIDGDGDGKAEVAVKTAPGTKDGTGAFLQLGPAAKDDDSANYRNGSGYVLSGPEYLTVFDGKTGAERATVNFEVPRGSVSAWGDDYGNRVDRFLATAAYLDDSGLPSFVMARGYYTRTTLTAWNFRSGKLTRLWQFDSNVTPRDAANHPYTGQGSHSMTAANVDDDLGQEIMYGAMAVDHTGAGLCSTGFGHGDAEHVGDLIPSRPGLEMFMCNEDGEHPAYHLRDARTCMNLAAGPINGDDTGRCVADDIDPSHTGAEMWASSVDGLFSAESNQNLGPKPGSQNFLVYWDGDESRELEDATHIDKYSAGGTTRLLSASGVAANNGTKSTPALSADLLGDWREEVVWRESDNTALRIYTTTIPTARRIYTLMHDPQYRVQVSAEQTGYNQPPHPSFHVGGGMQPPPTPNIRVP